MKYSVLALVGLILLVGCKDEPRERGGVASSKVKNVKLTFPNAENSKINFGDTLQVELNFDADTAINFIRLSVLGSDVAFIESDSLRYSIATNDLGGGYQSLRAEVMLADSSAMRGAASVRVVLPEAPAEWSYRLIESYPHDSKSYTQGLIYHEEWLYESAGRYGMSDIRKVRLRDGAVVQKTKVADDYFAEGIALIDDQLFQLTWRERQVMVYDLNTLERKETLGYNVGNGEGWGLCYNGEHLIFSDGSADLFFLNPDDWSVVRKVRVFDHQGDVQQINELEYVSGKIYANLLDSRKIAVIDPKTGAVKAYWNLKGLLESQPNVGRVDVMNGIAYRSDRSTFLITGKLWPYMFEVAPVY